MNIRGHQRMSGSVIAHFSDGAVLISSEVLQTEFALVKLDTGHGLFGRQKSKVELLLGDLNKDLFASGGLFNSMNFALARINSAFSLP